MSLIPANLPPSFKREFNGGDKPLTAPHSPAKRLPVVDKARVDPQMLKAAEGMEAMFLDYMMKVMRETVPKSEMNMDSSATAIYQGMMDTETAQKAARAGGIGLADQIIAYMQQGQYTGNREHAALQFRKSMSAIDSGQPPTDASTGGTHEGHSIDE